MENFNSDRYTAFKIIVKAISCGYLEYVPEGLKKYLDDPAFNDMVLSVLEGEGLKIKKLNFSGSELKLWKEIEDNAQQKLTDQKAEGANENIDEELLKLADEIIELEKVVFSDEEDIHDPKIQPGIQGVKVDNPPIIPIDDGKKIRYLRTILEAAAIIVLILTFALLWENKNGKTNVALTTKTDSISALKSKLSEKDSLLAQLRQSERDNQFSINLVAASTLTPPQTEGITLGSGVSFEFILPPKVIYKSGETIRIRLFTAVELMELKIRDKNLLVANSLIKSMQDGTVEFSVIPTAPGLYIYEIYNKGTSRLLFQGAFIVLPQQQ